MRGKKTLKNTFEVSIIGAGTIGLVHARIFNSLGANIKSICCSTPESAEKAKDYLQKEFGISTNAHSKIGSALNYPLDGVSICSPAELHFNHILYALRKKLPIFCEKPLFWSDESTLSTVNEKLNIINDFLKPIIFVNTSNTVLFDAIKRKLPRKDYIKNFKFVFHTNGLNTYKNIAVDLFPHAFSILLRAFGENKIESFKWKISKHNYLCEFKYGRVLVEFDFSENLDAKKMLVLKINDVSFERVQVGSGRDYKVFMVETKTKKTFKSSDPFLVYIRDFIQFCNYEKTNSNSYDESFINLKMMAYCMDLMSNEKNFYGGR